MERLRLGWLASGLLTVTFSLPAVGAAHAQDGATPATHGSTEAGTANDDEAARRHFRLGQAYYQNGQFAQAATEFEQAYRLSGRAPLLYNVYLSHRDALHTRQSYEALRRYLDEVPDPPDEDHLRARLHHLEQALANSPEEDPEVAPDTQPDVAPPLDPMVAAPPSASTSSASPAPFVVMGLGGGALVGGLVAGLLSRGARRDLDALCASDGACPPESNWESLRDRGRRSARAADALIGVGAAAAVTGVVLYFVMRPSDDDARASSTDPEEASVRGGFGCDATGCMATLGGQF